jgi:hypothetical protein
VAVLYGNGPGRFRTRSISPLVALRGLAVADLNGDEKPDIVTADELFDEAVVLLRQ